MIVYTPFEKQGEPLLQELVPLQVQIHEPFAATVTCPDE